MAQEYFPLTKQEAAVRGFSWAEQGNGQHPAPSVPARELPENIGRVYSDEILDWVIECESTRKPFKIVKEELKFLRDNQLPLPGSILISGIGCGLSSAIPRKLWERECLACGTALKSTYAADQPEKVFCEGCFYRQVY